MTWVIFSVSRQNEPWKPSFCNTLHIILTYNLRFQVVDGNGDVEFSLDELRALAHEGDTYSSKPLLANDTNLRYRQIVVEANVTETLTGKTLPAKTTTKTFHENSNKLRFMDVCPNVFKPGLTYLCAVSKVWRMQYDSYVYDD